MDFILLEGMQFYAYHGVYEEENKLGQRFLVSLKLFCDLKQAGEQDDLMLSVDYGEVYNITRNIVQGGRKKLLEAVAEGVATAILDRFERVRRVRVRIEKPEAPIAGTFASVGVVVNRIRTQEHTEYEHKNSERIQNLYD